MVSQLHEVLVAMVRESEALARILAEWATGHPLPEDVELRTRDQAFSELKPAEYRADLVLELSRDGRTTMMMVLEVQLARDPEKRYVWPGYLIGLRRQYRCPTMVVVLAPDPGVARWCAEPIDLDGQRSVMVPIVIGPDLVPVVTDPAEAERLPALAVLSVIAHGKSNHALDVGRAGLQAASTLDEADDKLYADLILHHLDAAARIALERERMALKLKNKYEYQSTTVRRILAEGEARGRVEGKLEGKHEGKLETLEVLLQARGFHLDEPIRARLHRCDASELDALVVRATTIGELDDLFED